MNRLLRDKSGAPVGILTGAGQDLTVTHLVLVCQNPECNCEQGLHKESCWVCGNRNLTRCEKGTGTRYLRCQNCGTVEPTPGNRKDVYYCKACR